jgi:hypothetical protein
VTRTYDITLRTRIPGQNGAWADRTFRVQADREFTAMAAARNQARAHYITGIVVKIAHVPTLGSRVNDFFASLAYRFARTNKAELVAGGPYGLRGLVYRFARRFL